MDTTVSARIPVAVKERASDILREIGATPSQLINAAYEYLLANHQLPTAGGMHALPKNTHRTLTPAQAQEINSLLDAMYIGPLEDDRPFKELLAEARDERFASYV